LRPEIYMMLRRFLPARWAQRITYPEWMIRNQLYWWGILEKSNIDDTYFLNTKRNRMKEKMRTIERAGQWHSGME
jgi:hypothetical protein